MISFRFLSDGVRVRGPLVLPFLGLGFAIALPFATASCGKKACFQWTEAEGACPSQEEAVAYFQGPPECGTEILSVDSAAEFDGELCCYDVTGGDTSEAPCAGTVGAGTTTTVTTGTGPSPPPQSCFTCPDVIFGGASPICETSFFLVDALMTCICQGPCAMACINTPCGVPLIADDTCFTCVQDTNAGCGIAFNDCMSDVGGGI